MSVGGPSGTRIAQFDQRGVSLTFDALEKVIVQAVAARKFEAAVEYVDQLLHLADQLNEYHEEYRTESERLADRDAEIDREEAIQVAIEGVASWAVDNDHPAAEWFVRGEPA